MNKQIQNQMSDEQLDAISGGCWAYGCNEKRNRYNDCDDRKKSHCEQPQPRRDYDDCRPSYRPHRCG